MKELLLSMLQRFSPDAFHAIKSYRFFQRCKKRFGALQQRVHDVFFSNGNVEVLTGPFQGLKYFHLTVWGSITPKWLGSYEAELHPIVEHCKQASYDTIVDIGAAEGYYAVGFAWVCPNSQVYAFDVDPIARSRQIKLSSLNHLSNLHIGKYCDAQTLQHLLSQSSRNFVLCDIEGFEYELLQPTAIPTLAKSDILIEIHPHQSFSMEEVTHTLISRFESTHDIQTILAESRDLEAWKATLPLLEKLRPEDQHEALSEHRIPKQPWLWLQAKAQ